MRQARLIRTPICGTLTPRSYGKTEPPLGSDWCLPSNPTIFTNSVRSSWEISMESRKVKQEAKSFNYLNIYCKKSIIQTLECFIFPPSPHVDTHLTIHSNFWHSLPRSIWFSHYQPTEVHDGRDFLLYYLFVSSWQTLTCHDRCLLLKWNCAQVKTLLPAYSSYAK